MADILIRGMEMPETCGLCKLCLDDSRICNGYCMFFHRRVNMMERDKNCPLVPLPEGHGKLIDGHKLYRALFATECGNIAADRDSEGWPKVLTYEAVKKAIQDATIIVPAEGGEADGNS